MAELNAQVMGALLTLLGYDGTYFRNVVVDSQGRVKVNVDDINASIGFATESTLAEVATRIGSTSSPGSGSVNAQLADLIALIGALSAPEDGSVNYQLGQIWASVARRNADRILDTYSERLTGTGSSGQIAVYGTTVPAGYLYIITAMWATITAGSSTDINLCWEDQGNNTVVHRTLAPAVNSNTSWSGRLVLKAGDRARCNANGVGSGTSVSFHVSGYKIYA